MTSHIRGIVLLPAKSPRYYRHSEDTPLGTQHYLMIRLIWRIGYMSFSYDMDGSSSVDCATDSLVYDIERHANIGGTE